jgi:HK97 family phage major capsid protein/HK97 family phage prohead protease
MKTAIDPTQFVTRDVTLENLAMQEDFLEFSFSSERAIEKWGYKEVLSHEKDSINLERLPGMNFLWNHNWDEVLGKVIDICLKDKRLFAKVKWSKKDCVEDYKKDVSDGILTNVSFTYTIDEWTETDNQITATKWTIFEISLCSVPADPSVGIGRTINTMTTTATLEQTRTDEIARIRTIQGMAKQHGFPELSDELIESGASIQEAQSRYLAKISDPKTSVARPVNPLDLSYKEQRSYSILKAIQATLSGDWKNAGFERECSLELAKRSGKQLSGTGFFLPVRDLKVEGLQSRADYEVGSNATGGYTVPTAVSAENFIDFLRNKAMIMRLGGTLLSNLQGNVDIPTQDSATTTFWVAESGAVTQAEATFGQRGLRPKTIGTVSNISRLTLLQSSIDVEQFVRRDFAAQIALGIDLAAIAGTGASNQPRGILNTSGIGSVALGTNGAAPTWDHIVALETEVSIDNADLNTCSYLTNAKGRGKLKRTEKFSGTNGSPIWEVDGLMSMINGYGAYASNQVPSNLTKGTGTNLSAILFGDFSSVFLGEWGVLEILVNPYSDAVYPSGSVQIRALQTVDIALRYPQSFAVITDAITT